MAPMPTFTIRPCVPAGVETVLRMKNLAWRQTYAGQLSDEVFEQLDADVVAHAASWAEAIGNGEAPPLVGTDSAGRVIGVAAGGPARGDRPPAATELYMVYVLAEAYGSGLGRSLVDAAIGTNPSFVWVLESNARAVAFYRKLGFEPDGAREQLSPRWNHQAEIRMVRGGAS